MSTHQSKMSSLTGGTLATSATLRALFAPEGGAGAGASTKGRAVESDPALRSKPDLA